LIFLNGVLSVSFLISCLFLSNSSCFMSVSVFYKILSEDSMILLWSTESMLPFLSSELLMISLWSWYLSIAHPSACLFLCINPRLLRYSNHSFRSSILIDAPSRKSRLMDSSFFLKSPRNS
jgi:hypothetical protein